MSVKRIAVYPGTFDPITLGHLDVIDRALKMFDLVIVAVTDNSEKKSFFSIQERLQLVSKVCKNRPRIKVEFFSGLLVDFMKQKQAQIIVRGLRELSDFEFEFQQAVMNRKMNPVLDTVFVMTDPKYFYVSSSMVRQIAFLHGNINMFVPKLVNLAIQRKLKAKI
ncbi:MAG: pantetheine-phosphate adenylyltransferase [Candidatus Diapherotrites archaeon]|nr:pantetheine-phosphate adenylyltransferase [Candidatus Diapherotrites archaeon]